MLNGAASHERNYQNDQQDYPEHSNEQDHGVAHSKGLEGEAQLALLGFCFAAYVLVRWTHAWARELVDRIFTAPAPHHVPGIVAPGAYEIVAPTRIDAVHAVARADVVVAAIAAYDVRLSSPVELVRAVIAVDGFRKRYPAGHHQRHQRHHQR